MMVYRCLLILYFLINIVTGNINTSANQTHTSRGSLPEIREGEPCIPGRMYKIECNACRCTPDLSLMCTKMACTDWHSYMNLNGEKKALRNSKKKRKSSYLPKVPNGVLCKPGKLYREGCKRCYCTYEHKIMCSNKLKAACTFDKQGHPSFIKTPEDVRPSFDVLETQELQRLSTASEKCEPGKTYKVDCNSCVCLEDFSLLCQKKMCLSYDDMHRIQAVEMSGKPCSGGTISDKCKKCDCVKGKTACQAILDCQDDILQLTHGKKPPEEYDPASDKCMTDGVYRADCNKCYCQHDGSLRCTQKTCLNFSQVKLLEKQRHYLEKHGL